MSAIGQVLLVTSSPRLASGLVEPLQRSRFELTAVPRVADLDGPCRPPRIAAILIDARRANWSDALSVGERASQDLRPLVVLTRTNESFEKIEALEGGADEAIWRLADPHEIAARLTALTRRLKGQGEVDFDGWRFDRQGRRLTAPDGRSVPVTEKSANLLTVLLAAPRRYHTRSEIQAMMVRRYGGDGPPTNWVVAIHRLRRTFEQLDPACRPIQTVKGRGYMLEFPRTEGSKSVGRDRSASSA